MIRKGLDARDWLSTIEPRSVRSVMKRVVEEVSTIDQQVGSLYEEGHRKDQGSEGSRQTYSYSLNQGKDTPTQGWAHCTHSSCHVATVGCWIA